MTQGDKGVCPYIGAKSLPFLLCGTIDVSLFHTRHDNAWSIGSNARERVRIDLVDFSPIDLNQQHLTNSRPLISLVSSNGQNSISHSANDGMTCGHLLTLRRRLNGRYQGIVEPPSWDCGPLIARYVASS